MRTLKWMDRGCLYTPAPFCLKLNYFYTPSPENCGLKRQTKHVNAEGWIDKKTKAHAIKNVALKCMIVPIE